ncbi:MAG: hypothetical protein MI807_16560 [Verrucomicrobiales bacterium]|nr:hypothetical protein [Verrucomicrobiales bacterium]
MSSIIHIGTRKGLFTFTRTSGKWELDPPSFPGIPVPMLLNDRRDNTLYVAAEHEHFGTKVHRSDDAGANWTELNPPVYPEKPKDAPTIVDPWRKIEIPWSLKKIWSLAPGGPDEPGTIWCGTIPGGLFRSDDRGESWQLNRPLWVRSEREKWQGGGYDFPGIHSICVAPDNPAHIAVAISCGGVWQTEDGGDNWAQTAHGMKYDFLPEDQGGADPEGQDPHCMVQCQSSPERFWVQHHSGIYRSDNRGRTWHEIANVAPSSFGFAVAVHPHDPDTAWFVPAKKDEHRYPVGGNFVATRTSDGGKTFETLDRGLPDEPAYDLVYRHALSVDTEGKMLAMGSTTGSVWISENSGESWQQLSAHLPPVYVVSIS